MHRLESLAKLLHITHELLQLGVVLVCRISHLDTPFRVRGVPGGKPAVQCLRLIAALTEQRGGALATRVTPMPNFSVRHHGAVARDLPQPLSDLIGRNIDSSWEVT